MVSAFLGVTGSTTKAPPVCKTLPWLARAVMAAAAVAAPAGWAATPLMIWPVDPVITVAQPASALWVENRGVRAVSLQVRVLEWRQSEGQEFFAQQKAVVASPPISVIPPGRRQMVRLVAVHPPPGMQEAAYRVLIDELPAPADPATASAADAAVGDSAGATGMGIRLSVRYAVPLFLYGGGAQPYRPKKLAGRSDGGQALQPAISWRTATHGNRHRLVVRNQGKGHARITAVRWANEPSTGAKSPEIPINEGLMGYVLPDSQMHWELDQSPPANPVLKANINGEETLVPRGAE